MREITFRGLTVDSRFMVFGNLIQSNTSEGIPVTQIERSEFNNFAQYEVDPKTVGQFTGLKDWSGRDIYEGDIIESDYSYGFGGFVVYEVQAGQYWIIIKNSRGKQNYHELSKSGQFGDETGIRLTNHEVIGNIHQNPELHRYYE